LRGLWELTLRNPIVLSKRIAGSDRLDVVVLMFDVALRLMVGQWKVNSVWRLLRSRNEECVWLYK